MRSLTPQQVGGLALAGIVIPDTIRDVGMSLLLLGAVVWLFFSAWVALHPELPTAAERDEILRSAPELSQSMWMAPAVERTQPSDRFR